MGSQRVDQDLPTEHACTLPSRELVKLEDGRGWWVKSKCWESSPLRSNASFGVTLDKGENFSESAFKSDYSSPYSPRRLYSPPPRPTHTFTRTQNCDNYHSRWLHLAFRMKSQAWPHTAVSLSHVSLVLLAPPTVPFFSPPNCSLDLSWPRYPTMSCLICQEVFHPQCQYLFSHL